jgi:activating signal cointegrator complex subunit 2
LPPYPSSNARSQLSHSQLTSLNQKISQSIQQALDLSPHALNSAAPAAFVSSYVGDVAQRNLDALIWDADPRAKAKPRAETTEARTIHARTLLLAERLASTSALDPTTLLDLSIAYASHPTRLRSLFSNAFSNAPSLLTSTAASALPAFTSVLRSHSTIGLHGLRKTAHAILCLLRVAPRELLRAFAHSRDFTLALAQAYDVGLGTASSSYGRLYLPVAGAPQRVPDDWEVLFLLTKADLLDAFHILVTALLNAFAALPSTDPSLPAEAEHAFDAISALQALPAPPRRPDDPTPPTPFLNRSLLADYQHAYDLSEALPHALRHGVAADDARLEWLSAVLREFDTGLGGERLPGPARGGDPGAFRLLLGSGVHHGVDDHGRAGATRAGEAADATSSGATTASGSKVVDPRVEEVRAILPDYKPEYIEALLQRAEYASVERVVEALLEGTAPPPEAIQQHVTSKPQTPQAREEFEYTRDRLNIFDGEDMDISKMRIGKKRFSSYVYLPYSICSMISSGGAAVTTR